jgi:hypothetical protein
MQGHAGKWTLSDVVGESEPREAPGKELRAPALLQYGLTAVPGSQAYTVQCAVHV